MLFRKNAIEKNFMNRRVLSVVKINTRISDTPCISSKLVLKYEAKVISIYNDLII
jgi:hypothetical protein